MENSAMLRAFRMIREKPVLLLLLLPVNVVSVLSVAFMPDVSRLLDFSSLMSSPESMMTSMQVTNMVTTLVSSVVSLVSLLCIVLLMPPAMELMRDRAAGRETPAGWFARGLRAHWWKPAVNGLVAEGIAGVLAFGLYIIFIIVMIVVMIPLMSAGIGGMDPYAISPDELMNGMLGSAMPVIVIGAVIMVLAIGAVSLIVRALLGLLLPALSDRPFGEAFKLMFSRRGFRKFPKLLGGLLLINLAPGLFYTALGAAYFLIVGIPGEPMRLVALLFDFMRSWPGILGLLLCYVIKSITYPFEFCVYQQVLDEERAESAVQLNP